MPIFHKHYMDDQRRAHFPGGLQRLGAVLQVEVNLPQPLIEFLGQQAKPIPVPATGWALIDTGASMTCVDETVLTSLGINPIGLVSLGTAAGSVERAVYAARLAFPEPKLIAELSRVVSVDLRGQTVLGKEFIALVGRDILSICQFIYDGNGGFFTLSF